MNRQSPSLSQFFSFSLIKEIKAQLFRVLASLGVFLRLIRSSSHSFVPVSFRFVWPFAAAAVAAAPDFKLRNCFMILEFLCFIDRTV